MYEMLGPVRSAVALKHRHGFALAPKKRIRGQVPQETEDMFVAIDLDMDGENVKPEIVRG